MTWAALSIVGVLLVFWRLGQLFFHYINTGEISEFYNSCYGYHFMDGDGLDPKYISFLFRGIHPGAITVDIISYFVFTLFAGMLWLPLSIILPLVGIAYLLRKKIAKKQDFVAKLDGTHPDITDGGSENMVQSATTSMRGH